jgi:ABC-type branched-subunit amino acid transport system substrate-binding protein
VAYLSTLFGRSWLGSPLAAIMVMALAGCANNTLTGGGGQAAAPTPSVTPAPTTQPAATVPAGPKIPGASATVGLLVPLSGPNAALGQALAQAAEMALFESGDQTTALVVHDTEAPPGVGATAQMAIDQGANILLGPVFAGHAKIVGPIAATAQVPVIAFTTDKSVAGPGLYVMGILPGLQIERDVGYAASQGFKRFAALLPNSPYGHAVADALGPATARYNAEQAQIEYYDPNAVEFSQVVQKLASDGPFDALLIPEGGSRLRSIAPLLGFYNIDTTKIKLLGSALWTDPNLASEPALIGAWFASPSATAWAGFSQRYRATYASDPPRLASIAYDAMTLAATLAKMGANTGASSGANTGGFADSILTRSDGFTGIDGAFRFRPDGLVERNLDIVEVRPSGFVVKDPAPKDFQPVLTN